MHFEFSQEDLAFAEQAQQWLRTHKPAQPAPHSGLPARQFALDWLTQLHRAGWAGISWPQAYGGQGLSLERQILWHEASVKVGAPSPLNPTFVGLNHAGPTLIACGSDAQKAYHLPRILAGEVIWCQGFSEPDSGSDLASLKTSGRVDGDHLVVNGQKIWSSYADIADYQELLIRTEPGSQRHKGLSWVICDMKTPGITVRTIENMAGARHFSQVFYDNVRIPLSQVVGALHDGWNVAMTTLSFERTTAAMALQLELSVKTERLAQWLGRLPPDEHCAVWRQQVAGLCAQAAALRALTYQSLFRSPATPFDGSMVRLYFAELSQRVHAMALELMGPAGADAQAFGGWTHDYLESYSETIAGGTAEIQRNIIGERILGLPRENTR